MPSTHRELGTIASFLGCSAAEVRELTESLIEYETEAGLKLSASESVDFLKRKHAEKKRRNRLSLVGFTRLAL